MIIVVSTDDKELYEMAVSHANGDPEIYGKCFKVFAEVIPRLAQHENLFISAHGAKKGDDGNPVIGSRKDDFYLNAVQLYKNSMDCFGPDYSGKIYISACEAADAVRGSFSFAEAFKNIVASVTKTAGVYGQSGRVGLMIPTPTSPDWIRA